MKDNTASWAGRLERFPPGRRLLLSLSACVLTTLLAMPLLGHLDQANIVMLFLLTVLVVAVALGRNAAILASMLSVLFFDIFFVPPRFSLAVSNLQYLVTFSVMLATALITAHLAAGLKQRAEESQVRERRTQALYQFARQLAGTLTAEQVAEIAVQFAKTQFDADAAVLLPTGKALAPLPGSAALPFEPHLADMALIGGQRTNSEEISSMGYAQLYLPLRASQRTRGVLALRFADETVEPTADAESLLDVQASLIAVAVERLHYVEIAQATELRMLTERLRSSILSALSHDLRTPLTAMVGLADSLFLIEPALPGAALDTARALREQARRLAGLVANLLDMARLNAGEVTLRREWQPLEEVIGASIKLIDGALAGHPVKVELPADLPLLEFDAVLIERVFCNLLENAAKYAPDGSPIGIAARATPETVEVTVRDHGPGFPAGRRAELFRMFVRGEPESGKPGTGLGLAICKAIVEAHGGEISADDAEGGGACVRFSLPAGTPPVIEEEAS